MCICTHTYAMECYSSTKKELLLLVTTWMGPRGYYAKRNKTERYHWFLLYVGKQQNGNRLINAKKKLMFDRAEVVGKMGKIGEGN